MLSVVTLILGALHYYIGVRLIAGTGLAPPLSYVAWAVLWFLLVSIPAGFVTIRSFPGPIARAVRTVSFFWIGAFGLTLTAVVLTDIVRGLMTVMWSAIPGERLLIGQVQAFAVCAFVLPAIALGMRTARGPARLEKVVFPLPHLGPAFEGFRIVQISDLHITESLNGEFLREVVERVNGMNPDLVAVTGDLIDGQVEELRPHVAPLGMLQAREGVFFVTGNHEYYFGATAWEAEVARIGVTVLHNSHRVLRRGGDSLVVAGVTDYTGGQFDPAHESRPDLALEGAPKSVPRILLAHQPKSARAAAAHEVDLQLSGHTHGGQIFPFMFFVRMVQPVIQGLREMYGIWVYTNRGTGYWGPPMRVGPTPEITEFTLKRGERLGAGRIPSPSGRGLA
jgi:predicted MPP superfamily phosphohydrolase